MYIFNHTSPRNPDSIKYGSVHGSELPFILGMPLGIILNTFNLRLYFYQAFGLVKI